MAIYDRAPNDDSGQRGLLGISSLRRLVRTKRGKDSIKADIEPSNSAESELEEPGEREIENVDLRDLSVKVDDETLARNEWLESTIDSDPNLPLPKIKLEDTDKIRAVAYEGDKPIERTKLTWATQVGNFDIISEDGTIVGYVVLCKSDDEQTDARRYFIRDIKVLENFQNKGFGMSSMLEILKLLPKGEGLRTEGVLGSDGIRLHEELVGKGVLTKIGSSSAPPVAYETTF